MPARNRFRSYGAPLRQSAVAETESQRLAREASDARNRRTIEELTDPTRKQIEQLQIKDLLTKLTDPYIKFVADLNRQRQEAADRDALSKLAASDPYGFVRYAEDRIKGLTPGDQGYDLWLSLLQKAEDRIEEEQWASDIESGNKTLEQFQAFLEKRLSRYAPGSGQAAEAVYDISQIKSAITARDEAAKDQKAYIEYINTKDHSKYMLYLQNKLARATTQEAAAVIVQQIGQLAERAAKSEESKRREQVAKIYDSYRRGKISASQATSQLTDVSDGQLTPSEVTAIQSTIHAIWENEQQLEARARSGQIQGIANSVALSLKSYNSLKDQVDNAIALGRKPDPKILAELVLTGNALAKGYDALSAAAPTVDDAEDNANAANSIRDTLFQYPSKIDQGLLGRIDLTNDGIDAFNKQLQAVTPETRLDLINQRIKDLKQATPELVTDPAIAAAEADIKNLTSRGQQELKNLTQAKQAPTPREQAALDKAWVNFVTHVAHEKHEDSSSLARTLGQEAFVLAVANAKTPEELASVYNLQLTDALRASFAGYKKDIESVYRTSKNGELEFATSPQRDPQTGQIVGNKRAIEAGTTALKKSRDYLAAVAGNGNFARDDALWEFATGNITIEELVMAQEQARQQYDNWMMKSLQRGGKRFGGEQLPEDEERQKLNTLIPQGAPVQPDMQQGMQPGMTDPMMAGGNQLAEFETPQLQLPETTDPVQKGLDWLNGSTNVNLPAFSLPELPEEDPFMPVLTEFEYDSPQLPFPQVPFPSSGGGNTFAPTAGIPGRPF